MTKRLAVLLLLLAGTATGQGRLATQRYDYVELPVKAIEASIPFYNKLGLTPVAVPGKLASSQAWFSIGADQQVRLVDGRTDIGGSNRPATTRIALTVSSLRRTEQTLRQNGLTVTRQPGPAGRPSLSLTDPDGYVIEFSEGKSEPGFLQSAAKSIWRSVTEVE